MNVGHGRSLFKALALAFLLAGGTAGWSQTNDSSSTQDLLIEKLDHVYKNLAPTDSSKVPVTLRLADLLSERARLASMKDLDAGCTTCVAGGTDRERALRLYQEVLPKVPESSRGRVLIQVGHLYELTGKETEAISYYEAILKDPAQASAAADANLALAEIHFKKNRYAEAKNFYGKVLQENKASSKGLAAYRLAWCELNLGEINAGLTQLKTILTTPDLQSKSGVSDGQADKQFVEEVSHDLATWMARAPVAQAQIDELAKLSPEAARQANMITLAAELERSGKKAEGVLVWQFVQNTAPQPEVRLEAQVRLVPLTFTESSTDKAMKNFEAALTQWQELKGCGKADCSELQKTLRSFVVNWNQSEKKAPSGNLEKSYQIYLQTFPHDAEMAQWGAQVAKDRKDWTASAHMTEMAVHELVLKKDDDKLESALLAGLETAELSKDKALWNSAARNYLSMSPKKTKVFEVRYQQAHGIYEAGDNKTAHDQLHALAMDEQAPRALRVQSAHLSLDALNLLKDETSLSEEAKTYAGVFGGAEAAEFNEIRYKSAMNNVAKMAGQDPALAFAALTAVDVVPSNPEDRKLYLRNKMILAEKSGRYDIASATTDEFLALGNLTPEERELGLSKKAWLSELRLDFVTALKTTQSLQTTLKPDQKALKLAIYADLSGAESQTFYQQYLNTGSDATVKQAIAAQLVRKSKTPLVELNKQSALIGKDPELLARLYTEIYVKNPEPKLLAKILADKRIEKTAWGHSLARVQMLGALAPVTVKIAGMKVDSKSQKTMAVTIKSRAAELAKLEKLAQKTVESGDWTTEIVSLSAVAKESDRFYQEILSLPMPEGLSGEEESQYLNLLTQQASPYKSSADSTKAKVAELWAAPGWKEALQKSLNDAGEFKALATGEVDALKAVADTSNLAALNSLTPAASVADGKPTREVLEKARNEVRQNPMDHARIEALLNLEKQAGDFAMVHYLEGRLQQEKTL